MNNRLIQGIEAHSALFYFIQKHLEGIDTESQNPHINPLHAHEKMRVTYLEVVEHLDDLFDEQGNLIPENARELKDLVMGMREFRKERAKQEALECR